MTHARVLVAAGLGLTLVAAACREDQLFTPPVPPYKGGEMFVRYVSMGNSLTAGVQSGGISDSTQKQSYAVKVGAAMGGDPFYRPSLAGLGCPPPFDTLFTASGVPHRLGGAADATCFLRSSVIPPYISNVAVPIAETLDLLHNGPLPGTNSNPLTQLFLGGRTQLQAMAAARPTFVSVWIGANDVFHSADDTANAGNPALITPVVDFQARYDSVLAAIDEVGTVQGGILISVPDVTNPPFFSYGFYYFGAYLAGKLPPTMTVSPTCAPRSAGGVGDTVLVPFPYGFGLIGRARAGASVTLDCTDDHNIEPAELANLHATVAAYNSFLRSRANTRGWAYLPADSALAALRADPNQVAPFPNTTATSCNGTATGSPFGLAFSCDGFHPSTAGQRLVAQLVVGYVNAKYGSAIPAVP